MKKVTISALQKKKKRGEKITVLTAYDYPFARLADEAGIDCLLVSDVLGQVGLGYDSTVPVSLDEIVHHTRAVLKGASRALVVAKMPFLSTAGSFDKVLDAAGVLIKETGAHALEIEGGEEILLVVEMLVQAGIPVMPHIGLTAQHFLRTGSFGFQGSTAESARRILKLAVDLQEAGAFAVMLECVPGEVAAIMTEKLTIPVIGIGSGAGCDGQILVPQDMLGLFDKFVPKFVKVYRNLSEDIQAAFRQYKEDVQSGSFPGNEHTVSMKPDQLEELRKGMEKGE